jgi:Leucine-rich repeat (LRR) protein
MNDKLKDLRSTLNQTIFQENHFTEESRKKVRERIRKSEENPFRLIKVFLQLIKNPIISLIGSLALCMILFFMIQDKIWKNEQTIGEKDSLTHDVNVEIINNFPPSIMENIKKQLQKSEEQITMDDLNKIKSLHITENMNIDSIVSVMKNIESISIHVPIDDWAFLNKIPELKELTISGNDLEDLSFLKSLDKLEKLHVDRNNLKSLEGIEHLNKLQYLYAGQNQLNNLEPLQDLDSLVMLELYDNHITSLKPIQNLNQLEYLKIDNNPISDYSAIEHLANLTFLSMGNNSIGSLEFLKEIKSLNRLQIFNTDISDLSVLSDKTQLSYLDIRGTNVTSIEPLVELKSLRILLVDKDKVTDLELLEGIEGLQISEETILAY